MTSKILLQEALVSCGTYVCNYYKAQVTVHTHSTNISQAESCGLVIPPNRTVVQSVGYCPLERRSVHVISRLPLAYFLVVILTF